MRSCGGGGANHYSFVVQTNSGTGAYHYSFVVQTYSGSCVDQYWSLLPPHRGGGGAGGGGGEEGHKARASKQLSKTR